MDFFTIALHETGHILGLQHAQGDPTGNIMREKIELEASWNKTLQTIDADSAFGAAMLYTIAVPEPATVALLLLAVSSIGGCRRRRRSRIPRGNCCRRIPYDRFSSPTFSCWKLADRCHVVELPWRPRSAHPCDRSNYAGPSPRREPLHDTPVISRYHKPAACGRPDVVPSDFALSSDIVGGDVQQWSCPLPTAVDLCTSLGEWRALFGAERVQDLLARQLPRFGCEVGFACVKPQRFPNARETKTAPLVEMPMRGRFDFRIVKRVAKICAAMKTTI